MSALGQPIYYEHNDEEFLEILDDYGKHHTAIHESAKRIRALRARVEAAEALLKKWKTEVHDNEQEADETKEVARLSYIVTLELCIEELAAALAKGDA